MTLNCIYRESFLPHSGANDLHMLMPSKTTIQNKIVHFDSDEFFCSVLFGQPLRNLNKNGNRKIDRTLVAKMCKIIHYEIQCASNKMNIKLEYSQKDNTVLRQFFLAD